MQEKLPLHAAMYIRDTSNKYNYEKSLFCSIVLPVGVCDRL